jgi:chromosome partitioning protein
VLLIDFDPQANLTAHLEWQPFELEATTYDLLRGDAKLEEMIIATATPNLWLAPSAGDLAAAEIELLNEIGRETILRGRIERAKDAGLDFDYILIDCAPQLGILALNALSAVDETLVPIQAEFFSLQGLSRLVETQKQIMERINSGLRLSGIVICMWKGQANLSHEVREEVKRVFGEIVYDTLIRQNVKLAEAPSAGKTIFEYDPESNGAQDYADLAAEFLQRHGDSSNPATLEKGPQKDPKANPSNADEKESAQTGQSALAPSA